MCAVKFYLMHIKQWQAEAAAERRQQFDVIDGGKSA
jgi:hypothetical protein